MTPRLMSSLFAATLIICGLAHADDLGVIGQVYPISEPHLLDFIRQRLRDKERSGELQKLEAQARTRGTDAVLHPKPVADITPAKTARTFYFDPTFTLDHNVFDGTGRLLFAAGTRKNPLEVVSLSKRLLFFDARDRRQVARVRALMTSYQGRAKPILVGGSYLDLMRSWQMRVYYDQDGILTRRFGITHVPAVVSQEGLRLRIDELVLP